MFNKMQKHPKILTLLLFSSLLSISGCLNSESTTNVKTLNNLKNKPENEHHISYESDLFAYSATKSNQNSCSITSESKVILQLANNSRSERQKCGGKRFKPTSNLAYDCSLNQMAVEHARDLFESSELRHTSAAGESLSTRANRLGISWLEIGENVASGYKSAEAAHSGWMQSGAHCKNIMNPDYNKIGAAEHQGTWVVVFAKIE